MMYINNYLHSYLINLALCHCFSFCVCLCQQRQESALLSIIIYVFLYYTYLLAVLHLLTSSVFTREIVIFGASYFLSYWSCKKIKKKKTTINVEVGVHNSWVMWIYTRTYLIISFCIFLILRISQETENRIRKVKSSSEFWHSVSSSPKR